MNTTYHRSVFHGHLYRSTLTILEIRIIWVTKGRHQRSRLIVVIYIIRWRIGICNGIDKLIDDIHNISDNFFAFDQCLVWGSLVNTWKDVTKSRLWLRIVHPFSHGHAGVSYSTGRKNYAPLCQEPELAHFIIDIALGPRNLKERGT